MIQTNPKTARTAFILDLPIPSDVGVLRVENTIARLQGRFTVDIGARCFLIRSNSHRRKSDRSANVDLTTLCRTRVRRIRSLLDGASTVIESGRLTALTMYSYIRQWVSYFDWCDCNLHSEMLTDVTQARNTFRAYSEDLRDLVGRGVLSLNTASRNQACILAMYRDYLMIEGVDVGVRRICKSGAAVNGTSVPPEEDQIRVLALCDALFDGIAPAVTNATPYPIRISTPEYLGLTNNGFWAFPNTRWFMGPAVLRARTALVHPCWAWDYINGRIAASPEIAHHFDKPHRAQVATGRAEALLKLANDDQYYASRIRLANVAMAAFLLLFSANTGMNQSQVSKLYWSDNFEIGRRSRGFCEIKVRAGGRPVSFHIGSKFVAKFKAYLRLRTFILGKVGPSDYLFSSIKSYGKNRPKSLRNDPLVNLFRILKQLDPSISTIKSRQWRAIKSDWLIRNTDIATAALILQSSESTITASYMEGSETQAAEELGEFFARLPRIILNKRDDAIDSVTPNLVGACSNFGHPKKDLGAEREPDCRQPEGCLYCENFRVHADEKDIRKLVSCRFCIGKTAHMSGSPEHFDKLFGEVLRRIDSLLSEISGISDRHRTLVDSIVEQVQENGQLDPYWSRKIGSLLYLGVVSA